MTQSRRAFLKTLAGAAVAATAAPRLVESLVGYFKPFPPTQVFVEPKYVMVGIGVPKDVVENPQKGAFFDAMERELQACKEDFTSYLDARLVYGNEPSWWRFQARRRWRQAVRRAA